RKRHRRRLEAHRAGVGNVIADDVQFLGSALETAKSLSETHDLPRICLIFVRHAAPARAHGAALYYMILRTSESRKEPARPRSSFTPSVDDATLETRPDVSAPTETGCSALSNAVTCTEYLPSGTVVPTSSLPSQVRECTPGEKSFSSMVRTTLPALSWMVTLTPAAGDSNSIPK